MGAKLDNLINKRYPDLKNHKDRIEIALEREASLILAYYDEVTYEEALKLAAIEDEDYQAELLALMEEYGLTLKGAKKFID